MMHKMMGLAVGLVLTMALSGCGTSDEPNGPGYSPIPDKQLFAQIGAIPGVSKVDVKYRDTFEGGQGYVGEIEVGLDADAATVLDRALAILRQGSWQASITVVAVQNSREISTDVLGLKSPGEPFLTERYGKQPGNGKPPKTTPTPTP